MADVQVRAREREESRCPYCHEAVAGSAAASCAGCTAPHHPSCLAEHGACGGCGKAADLAALTTTDRPCAFHDDCEGNAIAGDVLCARHRRDVGLGARDLRPTRDK